MVGTPVYVSGLWNRLTDILRNLVAGCGSDAWLETTTDPSFTNDTQIIARLQQVNKLKYELFMSVSFTGGSLAVASSNYHGATYEQAFAIQRAASPSGWSDGRWPLWRSSGSTKRKGRTRSTGSTRPDGVHYHEGGEPGLGLRDQRGGSEAGQYSRETHAGGRVSGG